MSSLPRWFIAPRAIPPHGPLKLGNVILSPECPDEPLYDSPDPLPASENVEIFREREFRLQNLTSSARRVGIATSFLSFLTGAGVDVDTKWSQEKIHQLKARTMDTMTFHPSSVFLEELARDEKVDDHIRSQGFRWTKLYMVVGVMIASGGSRTDGYSKSRDVDLQLSVDGTSMGVPISAGPKVGYSQSKAIEVGSEDADDFVFAFRLRKVKISKGEATLKKHYRSGALFDKDAADEDHGEYERSIPVVVDGLADEDVTGDEFDLDLEGVEAQDETTGQDCICIMPELE